MKTKLPKRITTVKQAQELLYMLNVNGESFHPEDDANQLSGDPFTKEEGDHLNQLMEDIYNLDGNNGDHKNPKFDPCEFLNNLDLETYIMGDQPTTCPKCGCRTTFTDEQVKRYKYQVHNCNNNDCLYQFKMVEK